MQQEDLISSLENPHQPAQNEQQPSAPILQQPITPQPMQEAMPLSEDLVPFKKKRSAFQIMNIIAYVLLGITGIFILILFILGFV